MSGGFDPVSAVVSGMASTVLGSILGGGSRETPAPPKVSEPTVMPMADSEAVKQSKRKSIATQIARRGRASTILTNPDSETLGG